LHVSRPGPIDLLRGGVWRHLPFLLRSLGAILDRSGLPSPVRAAMAIWTHVARQTVDAAPGPMAFVPALIHTVEADYPASGIGSIPRAVAATAASAGVEFEYGTKVVAIPRRQGRVRGVETDGGQFIAADAVVSNHSGVGTYLNLVEGTPRRLRDR